MQLASGRTKKRFSSAGEASANSKEPSVLYRAAQVYLAAGQEPKRCNWSRRWRAAGDRTPYVREIDCREAQLKRSNPREALNSFQEAQKLTDTCSAIRPRACLSRCWIFHRSLFGIHVCLKRRGEATSVFLDDVPSYHWLPPVYYYQGRARQGLNSPSRRFLQGLPDLKEKGAGTRSSRTPSAAFPPTEQCQMGRR